MVLILVLLEDGHGEIITMDKLTRVLMVLILVLLEDGRGEVVL